MINQKQMLISILSMKPGEQINSEVLSSLQSGFNRYLYDCKTLDEAFFFKQTRIRADYLKGIRDGYLRTACYLIEHQSPSDLTEKLEWELKRFEVGLWPKWEHLDRPPAGTSFLRWHLFYAFKTGLKMPAFRQLYRILFTDK